VQAIRSVRICISPNIISWQENKDEMDRECSKHERDENAYTISDGKPKVKRPPSIPRNR
jgi:hypothetical protein